MQKPWGSFSPERPQTLLPLEGLRVRQMHPNRRKTTRDGRTGMQNKHENITDHTNRLTLTKSRMEKRQSLDSKRYSSGRGAQTMGDALFEQIVDVLMRLH